MISVDTLVGSPASFMSSSHLIMGDRDAILVDASFAKDDAERVVDWVKVAGKRLTTVFVTHAHPDHFLGVPVVLAAYPEAAAVATSAVVDDMKTAAPQYHATFAPIYGDNLAAEYAIPAPLESLELDLEGERLPVIEIGPGEAGVSSALYVPSIRAMATADQVFSGIHVWLVEYRPEGSLEGIRRLREAGPISLVLPGHGDAGGPELLDANERYIRDFMAAASAATTKDEGVATMTRAYPDLELPVILDFGMQAAVEGRSYPDIMRAYLDAGS
jgi:glyoxylase-like metal-dependent hydrolase (beta-lactamase superfamily II)